MPTKKNLKRREKVSLPGGCWRSAMSVYPSNWKTSITSMQTDWYIQYRFYDPSQVDAKGKIKPKLCPVKGMNDLRNWQERIAATKILLADEIEALEVQGYNPIAGTYAAPIERSDIEPSTPFLQALHFAKGKLNRSASVLSNLKSILTAVDMAAKHLKFHTIHIGDIKRKHLKLLLDQCKQTNANWTENTFNYYRSHLSILFNELIEYDAVESNPFHILKKQKHVRAIRETLSDEERLLVKTHLGKVYPELSRLMEIFYYSGIRETEILGIKTADVDLVKERIKITLRKGGQPVEEYREIRSVALLLWQEVMQGACTGDYVFSYGFKPGTRKPAGDYITKSWEKWVKNRKKKGIGITKDFYSLKHSHTTDVIDSLEQRTDDAAKEAAQHNGHRSTDMVNKVYDVKAKGRKGKLVKMLPDTFIKKEGEG